MRQRWLQRSHTMAPLTLSSMLLTMKKKHTTIIIRMSQNYLLALSKT